MEYNIKDQGAEIEVSLKGRFTFSDHSSFRKVQDEIFKAGRTRCVFEMSQLEFIDSAALGMMLLTRDISSKKGVEIILKGAKDQVQRVMSISRFHLVFKVE